MKFTLGGAHTCLLACILVVWQAMKLNCVSADAQQVAAATTAESHRSLKGNKKSSMFKKERSHKKSSDSKSSDSKSSSRSKRSRSKSEDSYDDECDEAKRCIKDKNCKYKKNRHIKKRCYERCNDWCDTSKSRESKKKDSAKASSYDYECDEAKQCIKDKMCEEKKSRRIKKQCFARCNEWCHKPAEWNEKKRISTDSGGGDVDSASDDASCVNEFCVGNDNSRCESGGGECYEGTLAFLGGDLISAANMIRAH